ncbi:MAG TPA: VCBS repeat-containing protein [Gemmataceae bacterium]|nr:VCBS repeat-containing protein [Gemmataceae bacterium]
MRTQRIKTLAAWCATLTVPVIVAFGLLGAGEAERGGTIRFSEHLIQDKYGYAYGIAVADLDGDGDLDITSSDTKDNEALYWFENDGKGNFTRHFIAKKEPGWFERHAIGDINGDGKPDVVVVKNFDGHIVWFENSGKPAEGPWKRHVITTSFKRAYDVALADVDGDGNMDVAATSWIGNSIAWFENPHKTQPGKEWAKHMIDENIKETRTVRFADFNRDGKPDILATARVGNLIAWYENPGPPADKPWKRHIIDDRSVNPTHGHPVDLDGDGDMDVVMALGFTSLQAGEIVWYENVGKPGDGTTWKKHVICANFPCAFEAFAADLNGDGHIDVVATAWGAKPGGRVVWFENPGDPKKTPWKMHVLKEGWTRANQVLVADLNADNRPDIIASAEHGSNEVRWWRNEGRVKKR